MTNIWKDTFEEIRKPHFSIEDPYTSLQEKKEKEEKEGKPKRWWDDDGDGVGYEPGEVSGKFKRKKVKEEVEELDELNTETIKSAIKMGNKRTDSRMDSGDVEGATRSMTNVDRSKRALAKKRGPGHTAGTPHFPAGSTSYRREEVEQLIEIEKLKSSSETKHDVRRGIKNSVTINPEIKEQTEAWVSELVEGGHDLSEFTWNELYEIYESADMPAAGDAQTVSTGDQKMLNAKRRVAQAQIRADLAKVQLQKASVSESLDSVVEYLSQRTDIFRNIEEAVFDPKRSRMRPASERSQRSMTDSQRKAAEKEAKRVAAIHSKGETVLTGLRPQGQRGKVKTTPEPKATTPEANRTVKGRKDKLASAASQILKDLQK